jgi:hypothetical protein
VAAAEEEGIGGGDEWNGAGAGAREAGRVFLALETRFYTSQREIPKIPLRKECPK